MGWNGVCFIVLYCTSDVFVKVSLSLLVFLDLKDPFVPSVTICFMASKQYQITFGYVLCHEFPIITTIIDMIAKFYVIQEKWTKTNYMVRSIINVEENGEYCEWDEENDEYCPWDSEFDPCGYRLAIGQVLFEPHQFLCESTTLRWELEYSMFHCSKQALFIGISNCINLNDRAPHTRTFADDKMFMGYGISFYNRKNDNPYIFKLVKGRSGKGYALDYRDDDFRQPNEMTGFVFGKITFIVNIKNRFIYQTLHVHPHPSTGKKMFCMKNSHYYTVDYASNPSLYWLTCSFPFGASLKLDSFSSTGEFYYRDEWDPLYLK